MANRIRFSVTRSMPEMNTPPLQENETAKKACDTCRQRKVKCDKNKPCNQCISSFNDCIYSESTRKKRKTTQERVTLIESKLQAMEEPTQLAASSLPTSCLSGINSPTRPQMSPGREIAEPIPGTRELPVIADPYANLYHSVDKGGVEFQGYFADRTFIKGFQSQLGYWSNDLASNRISDAAVPGLFDTTKGGVPPEAKLPSKNLAMKLVEAALDSHTVFSVIHRPSFDSLFTLVYSLDESDYGTPEQGFLPLLYAVMAYGSLFIDMTSEDKDGEMLSLGSQYYDKSRQLQDIADCKDLVSLQAIFFKILFLLVTSRVFTCYTYTSTALSVALRMGLHRSFTNPQDLITRETGKRVFWALYILASDVATTCGLPNLLSREVVDQEIPLEINDIYIEQHRIIRQPENEVCYVAAANSYRRLHAIIQDVTKHIYSENRFNRAQPSGRMSYSVSIETLKGVEDQFKRWRLELPVQFMLGNYPGNRQLLTTQYTLAILYAHSQLYLYRLFLQHFLSPGESIDPSEHPNPPWLATICVQACENIIMLCEDMYRQGLLSGGNWLVSRALLSSTHTLFYVVLTSSGTRPYRSISRCLALGRKVSDRLAKRNIPAHRWKVMMTVMIATLPSSARHIKERLLELETKLPDISVFQAEQKDPDESYTKSLGQQTLSPLHSNSSTVEKSRWLSPHLLEALGYEYAEKDGCLSPSWRIIPRPQPVMTDETQESSDNTLQLDGIENYLFDGSGESDNYVENQAMPLGAGELDLGNLEDFLDLQNLL